MIVSFGYDDGEDIGWPCNAAWQFSKYAVISKDHPKYNMSQAASAIYRNKTSYASTERASVHRAAAKAELPAIHEYVAANRDLFSTDHLNKINAHFVAQGLAAVVA